MREPGGVFTGDVPAGLKLDSRPRFDCARRHWEEPAAVAIAHRLNRTPAQVLLGWALQRGTAILTTPKTPERAKENFEVSELPADAMAEIDAIEKRQRFNLVTGTGIPGFIAKGN